MRPSSRAIAALLSGSLMLGAAFAGPVAGATTSTTSAAGVGASSTVAPPAKVVIIVGPTHGNTNTRRAQAEAIAAEALKHTPDVTRIYSPNATWAAVKPALQGANIVVYLGHGNGWPSPYTYDPNYTTKDGFGLNVEGNLSDYALKYYGEPYIRNEVRLAPNAVVILNHACYSSGASESGDPEPTLAVAQQRVDNFGSAFLSAGARAVIAAYHGDGADYVRSIFTANATILDAFRMTRGYRGNEISSPSARTPGMTVILDPETPGGGGYLRSIVGDMNLLTDVAIGGDGSTDGDPATVQVPGAAEAGEGGVTFRSWPGGGSVTGSANAGVALRVSDSEVVSFDGSGLPDGWDFYARTFDGSKAGWVAGDQLIPRDSRAPIVRSLSVPSSFSPGGADFTLEAAFTEIASASATLRAPGGSVVASTSVVADRVTLPWDGRAGGARAPLGTYSWSIDAADEWGNVMPRRSGTFVFWDPSAPSTYVPLSPARLLDTRVGNGLSGAFAAGASRTFAVAGRGGVPAGAVAVTGNLTMTNATREGYLSLTPLPTTAPSTSTLNFPAGDTRANGVTVTLGPDGSLAVFYGAGPGGAVHVIFDVTGYYLLSGS